MHHSSPLRSRLGLHTSVLWALCTAGACTGSPERSPVRPDASAAPAPAPSGAAEVILEPTTAPSAGAKQTPMRAAHREIMGTWFEVKVLSARPDADVQVDLQACLDEIARLEDVLSEWRPQTEISRINRMAGGEPVAVGEDTWTVVKTGQQIAALSEGAFDLTWAALRGLYLFGPRDPHRIPTQQEIAEKLRFVGYRDLLLDETSHTVRLRRSGMAIGTGGIAKGYALDRVQTMLISRGYPDFLLFAGGQVQTHGSRDGRAWRVGIKHPRKDTHVGAFEIYAGSISTSGDYEHSYEVDGQRIHHIIDLGTGKPASRSAAVTLVAPRGIDADALSTACFVKGPASCIALLEALPYPTDAVIIAPDMSVHMTKGIAPRVRFDPPLVDGKLAP